MASDSITARFQNSDSQELAPTSKTSLRSQYLQEKARIQHEIGDLEQIRVSLGYSQRRMCQLLLVDPSAWTRWCKTPSGAPPHIYQALRWLVELKKVNPDAAAPSDVSRRIDFIHSTTQSKIKELENSVAMMERALTLNSTVQPAPISYSPHEHLEKEILTLKSQLALLIAKNSAKNTPPKKKRLKAKSKEQKKTRPKSKSVSKKRSNKRSRVAPKKTVRKKK